MRTILTGALLLLGATPLGAQQDSTARRDSLLAREQRRIAGEAVSRVPDRTVDNQRGWRSRLRVGLGVASGSTWLEQDDDVKVKSGLGPAISAEARFPRPRAMEYLLGIRGTRAPVTVDARPTYDADAVWVLDAFAGVARVLDSRVALRGGFVGAFVAGGNIAPFDEASRFAPGAEIGAAYKVADAVPLWLSLGAQALRYGSGGSAPVDAKAGAVYRVILELRHGR